VLSAAAISPVPGLPQPALQRSQSGQPSNPAVVSRAAPLPRPSPHSSGTFPHTVSSDSLGSINAAAGDGDPDTGVARRDADRSYLAMLAVALSGYPDSAGGAGAQPPFHTQLPPSLLSVPSVGAASTSQAAATGVGAAGTGSSGTPAVGPASRGGAQAGSTIPSAMLPPLATAVPLSGPDPVTGIMHASISSHSLLSQQLGSLPGASSAMGSSGPAFGLEVTQRGSLFPVVYSSIPHHHYRRLYILVCDGT